MFPNHIPNPEDKTAMKAITQAVLDNKADLGIIFDTDVDRYIFLWSTDLFYIKFVCLFLISVSFRSAAVDSTGLEFNRNRLIALMSAIVLEGVRFFFCFCNKALVFQNISFHVFPRFISIFFCGLIFLASGNYHCYRQRDFRRSHHIY